MDLDAVWGGILGWSRNGCIRCGGDRQRGRDSFGVNMGRPIVTSGDLTLLCGCVKMHEPIEMQFGVVRGVSRGMGVLVGANVPQGEEEVLGFFDSICLNGIFLNKNVLDSCVKS